MSEVLNGKSPSGAQDPRHPAGAGDRADRWFLASGPCVAGRVTAVAAVFS
ncbi:hypothetical protein [Streptomyces shenzhenensis]